MDYWDQDINSINEQLIPEDPTELNRMVTPKTEWEPPYGNIPFSRWEGFGGLPELGKTVLAQSARDFYSFPWYLSFMWLWHGTSCLLKTGKWPVRILYFRNGFDRELYPKVLREYGLLEE